MWNPSLLFNLWYAQCYGPIMESMFKTIGTVTALVGNFIVSSESAIFESFDYVALIYHVIKTIESLCPVIEVTPRRSTGPRTNKPYQKASKGKGVGHMNARN